MRSSIEKHGLALAFLIVPCGLTHKIVQKVFREKLGVKYDFPAELDDLKKVTHDRWPKQSYFIRHGGHQEATGGDKQLKLLAAEKIWERGIKTMTSLEVSQFAFEYFFANGAPADSNSISLGSGSRHSDGCVPHVYFDDGRVGVDWYILSNAGSRLRARSAAV